MHPTFRWVFGDIHYGMADPLRVVCPTCDAPIGTRCALLVREGGAAPDCCPERKIKADLEDEQDLEQLIYEW